MGEHDDVYYGNYIYPIDYITTTDTDDICVSSISASDSCIINTTNNWTDNLRDAIHNVYNDLSKVFNFEPHDAYELVIKDILNDNKEEEAMDLHPVKIIFNDPVSVVFWEDGEKTVVRRHEGEPYDKYTAFCAALAIKIFGSNTEVNRIVRNGIDQQEKDRKKAEAWKQKLVQNIMKSKKSTSNKEV